MRRWKLALTLTVCLAGAAATVEAKRSPRRESRASRDDERTSRAERRARREARARRDAAALTPSGPDALARVQGRVAVLAQLEAASLALARQQALVAYRLTRRRTSQFFGVPAARPDDAQAIDAALRLTQRGLQEAQANAEERQRLLDEAQLLRHAAAKPSPPPEGWAREFRPPVRGTVVTRPGLRRDLATHVEARATGVQILARLNQPVHATAPGRVHGTHPLGHGGFALVLAHEDGWTSVLSGLREVHVAPGETVAAGQPIALVGRNLDGAPVLGFELWRAGTAVDPSPVLSRRRRSEARP